MSTSAVCFMTLTMTLKVVTMQGMSTKLSDIIKERCFVPLNYMQLYAVL